MLAKLKSFLSDPHHIVNALTAVTGVLAYFQGSELIAANPKATAAIGTFLGVINVLLRVLTPAAAPAADPKAAK